MYTSSNDQRGFIGSIDSDSLSIQTSLALPIDLLTILAMTALDNFNAFMRTCRMILQHLTPLKNKIISKFSTICVDNDKGASRDENRVAYSQKLNNGKLHGLYREYIYRKGVSIIAANGMFHNNKRVGVWDYAVLPDLYVAKRFVNDRLEGDTYMYKTNARDKPYHRRSYMNNQLHGSEVDYDLMDLSVKDVSCRRRGVRHGATYTYDRAGDYANYEVIWYDNGVITERRRVRDGKMYLYELYNAGRLIWGLDHRLNDGTRITYRRIGTFSRGYTIIVNRVSCADDIIHQARFVNGLAQYYDIQTTLTDRGTVATRTPYKYGEINGVVITRLDGALSMTAQYRNNRRHGLSIAYARGKPIIYISYDKDSSVGVRVRDHLVK